MADKKDKPKDKDKPQDEGGQIDLIGPSCGERLLAARKAQGVSVAEIAKELHISEQKVEALERNEFEILGAQVFAKGYIRKYAQMVRVNADEIVGEYDALAAVDAQPVFKARPRPRREMSPGPWIAVIVLLIIAATVYWAITSRPDIFSQSDQQPDAPTTEETPLQDNTVAIELRDAAAGLTDAAPEAVAQPPEAADEPVAETVLPQAQVPAVAAEAGRLTLLLTFSGDCWTEISDGSGRRLYFGQGSDGRTVELSGVAPFNVLFGNAGNVSLRVDGAAYDIGPVDRLGRARFTIAGN
ncbi:MAG: RodZ domain-containing protein [Woeseiaceae bacterium]